MTQNVSPAVICQRAYHWHVKVAYTKVCSEIQLLLLLTNGLHPLCSPWPCLSKHLSVHNKQCLSYRVIHALQRQSWVFLALGFLPPFSHLLGENLPVWWTLFCHPHFNYWILFHLILSLGTCVIILRSKILKKLAFVMFLYHIVSPNCYICDCTVHSTLLLGLYWI